ncbi:asparagine--tRNA ligase [Mycoplasma sp. CAG:956]|nr:asparagine--tRNA ligase [Mycoplasma sp. CAG:956]
MDIKDITKDLIGKEITICGWVKNHRKQATFGFINLFDGTCTNSLQVVYDNSLKDFEEIGRIHIGSSIKVIGTVKESEGKGQDIDLVASDVILLGDCPEDYPIQPKRHTLEYLRSVAYLRPRTNTFQSVFRIRSAAAQSIHEYFRKNNYLYVHTPLITTADCEGSDQMFKLTTFDLNNIPMKDGKADMSKDLFGRTAFITGSGQLHGETFAHAFKKIYTFGPTFRTENSNTKTHANEFWMIEPEICFCDLDGLMDIEEDFLKYIVNYILTNCKDDVEFLDKFVSKGLKEKLEKLASSKFTRIDHKDVIDILKKAPVKWEFTPEYGEDIAKEHERYITEYFGGPVFIKNWPKDIKAYYMKVNSDNETVAAVDLEVPGCGELMGGSQREENYEKLVSRMAEFNVNREDIEWYLNLRKYGTTIHSGFGMGFERLIMYLTGMENIRDVIPYPRTPGSCEY